MRDHNLQLPDYVELQHILEKEAVREVAPGKLNMHYVDFSPIIDFCKAAHISSEYFTRWQDKEALQDPLFWEQLKSLESACIAALGIYSGEQEIVDRLRDYLSEEDAAQKADMMMVCGAPGTLRIDKAIELYHAGYAEKILLTGKGPVRGKAEISEAEAWQKYAIEQGIPEEVLLMEKSSISIPDNVKSSLNMLDASDMNVGSMILVTSPYALRRTYAYMRKFLHTDMSVYRVASGSKYTKENWYTTPEGQKVIVNEYIKLKVSELLNTV